MPRLCSIDGCRNAFLARGRCKKHYSQWYSREGVRHARSIPASERFWPKVDKLGPDDCWEWTAARRADGYGQFNVTPTSRVQAHRYSYSEANGAIPNGMQIDHTCFNRACVNPAHLRLATNKQNHENLSGATRRSSTGVLGVFLRNGRYCAAVKNHGVRVYEEYFDDLEQAAKAVESARQRIFTHSQSAS